MNYKTKINKTLMLLFVAVLFISACSSDDDPEPELEQEIITRVEMEFTNTLTSEVVTARFNDPDGPGGNEPITTNPTLSAGTVYSVSLKLYNDLEGENITEEIEEEDDEHQFFFIQTGGVFSAITYDDLDAFGKPVGLKSKFTTGTAGAGTLRVILRHEPNKANPGVASGIIDNAGGDTDIDIIFNVTVQ